MDVAVVQSSERPDLEAEASTTFRQGWPEFIFHDALVKHYLESVDRYFPQFDLLLLANDEVVGGGWGVPLRWDGAPESLPGGYTDSLRQSLEAYEQGVAPDTLVILGAAVRGDVQRRGLATFVLAALRKRAQAHHLKRVIAPVRPALKASYPLVPMVRFASWTRADGLPLDPWIRTHWRMGAKILGPALNSQRIVGTVAEWEAWTEMAFPETGRYVVPGALDLVAIDCEADQGEYIEPNLWMQHI